MEACTPPHFSLLSGHCDMHTYLVAGVVHLLGCYCEGQVQQREEGESGRHPEHEEVEPQHLHQAPQKDVGIQGEPTAHQGGVRAQA